MRSVPPSTDSFVAGVVAISSPPEGPSRWTLPATRDGARARARQFEPQSPAELLDGGLGCRVRSVGESVEVSVGGGRQKQVAIRFDDVRQRSSNGVPHAGQNAANHLSEDPVHCRLDSRCRCTTKHPALESDVEPSEGRDRRVDRSIQLVPSSVVGMGNDDAISSQAARDRIHISRLEIDQHGRGPGPVQCGGAPAAPIPLATPVISTTCLECSFTPISRPS